MHGPSTASSMAETANRILGMQSVVGIDAALTETPSEVYTRVLDIVKEVKPQEGVFCLVDMGSLSHFAERITAETGIPGAFVFARQHNACYRSREEGVSRCHA